MCLLLHLQRGDFKFKAKMTVIGRGKKGTIATCEYCVLLANVALLAVKAAMMSSPVLPSARIFSMSVVVKDWFAVPASLSSLLLALISIEPSHASPADSQILKTNKLIHRSWQQTWTQRSHSGLMKLFFIRTCYEQLAWELIVKMQIAHTQGWQPDYAALRTLGTRILSREKRLFGVKIMEQRHATESCPLWPRHVNSSISCFVKDQKEVNIMTQTHFG